MVYRFHSALEQDWWGTVTLLGPVELARPAVLSFHAFSSELGRSLDLRDWIAHASSTRILGISQPQAFSSGSTHCLQLVVLRGSCVPHDFTPFGLSRDLCMYLLVHICYYYRLRKIPISLVVLNGRRETWHFHRCELPEQGQRESETNSLLKQQKLLCLVSSCSLLTYLPMSTWGTCHTPPTAPRPTFPKSKCLSPHG